MRSDVLKLFFVTTVIALFGWSIPGSCFELVALVYPGAVREKHDCEKVNDPNCGEIYYTNDPMEKVVAFYKSKGINLDQKDSNSEYRSMTAVIFDSMTVYKMMKLKGESSSSAVVTVRYKDKPGPGCPGFSDAKEIITAQEMMPAMTGSPPMSGAEKKALQKKFDGFCKTYEHLQWSFYPFSDQKDAQGRYIRFDRQIMKDVTKASDNAMLMHAMSGPRDYDKEIRRLEKKIARRERRGRTEQAEKLKKELEQVKAEKAAQAGAPKKDQTSDMFDVRWNELVKRYEELNKHAYTTSIYIDHHPKNWTEERVY